MAQAQSKKNSGGLGAGLVVLIAVIVCNILFYTVFKSQIDEKGHEKNII